MASIPTVAAAVAADTIGVEVTHSPGAGVTQTVALRLPAGSVLADALRAAGLAVPPGSDDPLAPAPPVGIWGKLRPLDHPLRERDRVELYRPLIVDPKEARRLRYAQHRERLRAGAKG